MVMDGYGFFRLNSFSWICPVTVSCQRLGTSANGEGIGALGWCFGLDRNTNHRAPNHQ